MPRVLSCSPPAWEEAPSTTTQMDSPGFEVHPTVSFLHKLAAGTLTVSPNAISSPPTRSSTCGEIDTNAPLPDMLRRTSASLTLSDLLPRSRTIHHHLPGPSISASSSFFGIGSPFHNCTCLIAKPDAHKLSTPAISAEEVMAALPEVEAQENDNIDRNTELCFWDIGLAEHPCPSDDTCNKEVQNRSGMPEIHIQANENCLPMNSSAFIIGHAHPPQEQGGRPLRQQTAYL
jgi:hypothetical protein